MKCCQRSLITVSIEKPGWITLGPPIGTLSNFRIAFILFLFSNHFPYFSLLYFDHYVFKFQVIRLISHFQSIPPFSTIQVILPKFYITRHLACFPTSINFLFPYFKKLFIISQLLITLPYLTISKKKIFLLYIISSNSCDIVFLNSNSIFHYYPDDYSLQ